ncbi:uncharacterized protein DUF4301 [Gelidibacter algens]|uniref:Uncharacterized protein DUF4301 n=1 Tax=Gelidibacter algens TaxID=49280 RepID=A0A1A7QVQ1_9FLAO|nr:DUF4301 family protein [Gelidibacter algens]OBX23616.1 NAD metabolism ATPase/kinase [Gelidibacter algens]RAJ18716.1 uncharacterized protein DUF4301 [Gelidibacter algens]
MKFTEKDIEQIENKSLTLAKVQSQLRIFESGLPFVNLNSAATIGHGVARCSDSKKMQYIDYFDAKRNGVSIAKFVPASGAATRMFKSLFRFIEEYMPEEETINSFINRYKDADLSLFFVGIEKFPFYQRVLLQLKEFHPEYAALSNDKQKLLFAKTMLDEDKMNYGFYPKGLLPFHKYKNHLSTAFEEHLFEAALYASTKNIALLHFTISERYKDVFDEEFKRIQNIVEHKTNTKFEISFSYQKESTDTIAVSPTNEPFREDNGELTFRPSGHGALLENLNQLNADVIFIKNIDNVVVYKYEKEVAEYKKMLAGMMLEIQDQVFEYLNLLENKVVSEEDIQTIAEFLVDKLHVVISNEFEKYSTKYQIDYLFDKLNRPIRICGMVKNEGEPGGGPFWVKGENGEISLQIIESAQIDLESKSQKEILKNATHFNPVDLICGIKNFKGEVFDLQKFVNHKTAFITMKTKSGKDLKALELPGLWNGSMAGWNTIFVEVPLVTFNPVKTVTDLLKPTHQIK